MGRILALDYGLRRTGVAVSDPLRIIAGALDTVQTPSLMKFLKDYISSNQVDIIVVGMPKQMNGQPSESFTAIEPFVAKLAKQFPEITIEMFDERFTSVLAHRAMLDGGLKKMQRRDKALVDRISATIILQDYLESKKYKSL
ncbi:MAG: Holliday junction resolvase RuvX [Rikenellaceae bacterium]